MKRISAIFVVLLVFFLASCKEDEKAEKPKSTLEGIVRDEFGGPLDSVKCVISSSSFEYTILTNDAGRFTSPKIETGSYLITISKANYTTGNTEVELKETPTMVELVLSSSNSFLRVSDSLFVVSYSGGGMEIIVESNSTWTATTDAAWLKSSTTSGEGNASLKFTWEKSEDNNDRIGMITLRSGSIERRVKVKQTAPVKLLSATGIIGNYEDDVQDSIKLVFNKPVTVNSITTSYQLCLSEMNSVVYGNNLSFSYSCARLGGEYPFSVSVKEGKDVFNFSLTIPFYTKKLNVVGQIVDYFITDDNTSIWAITNFPNKVLEISLTDLAVTKEHTLDFAPNTIKWNHFKNTLNVFSLGVCYTQEVLAGNCKNNYLLYLNPEDFSITRSKIEPIEGYDFSRPYLFPRELCLFDNGMGIIRMVNYNNYTGWRFIDSSNSDSTFISESHLDFTVEEYDQIVLNHNRTAMYLIHPLGSTSIDVFELGGSVFRTYTSPLPGRSNYILPNKKKDRVLHAQLYQQFISDMDGYMSKVSYLDTRSFYGGIDFSYKPGEDETVYYLADGSFQILDFKNGFTNMSTDALNAMVDIQSTTDGKDLIGLYKNNSDGGTTFFVFDIDATFVNRTSTPDPSGRIRAGTVSHRPSVWVK